jgi:hypothetical protein
MLGLRARCKRALRRQAERVASELDAFRPKEGVRHSIQTPPVEDLPRVLQDLRARLERERALYGDINLGARAERRPWERRP